jgi:hypothetical protein
LCCPKNRAVRHFVLFKYPISVHIVVRLFIVQIFRAWKYVTRLPNHSREWTKLCINRACAWATSQFAARSLCNLSRNGRGLSWSAAACDACVLTNVLTKRGSGIKHGDDIRWQSTHIVSSGMIDIMLLSATLTSIPTRRILSVFGKNVQRIWARTSNVQVLQLSLWYWD